MDNTFKIIPTILFEDDIKRLGFSYAEQHSGVGPCKKCLLRAISCDEIECADKSIADPKGLGVELILTAIKMKKAHD